MKTETDLALLLLFAALFALTSGAYAAMQILAYTRPEHDEDAANGRRFVDRLLADAVPNYLALGLGRVLTFVLLIAASYRFAAVHLFGTSVSTAVVAFILLCLLVPFVAAKLLAVRDPEGFAEMSRFVAWPAVYILRPFVFLFTALLKNGTSTIIGALAFPVLPFKKKFELFGYKNGQEETDEPSLMSSVFDFEDTRVREVMVPRIDMVAVNIHLDPAEALQIIIDAGHSRVPVFDESIDKVVGVVHTKDLLKKIVQGGDFSLLDVRRNVYFVPESKKISELLSEFRKRRIHIAIVVDEYGGTAGLVTLEDILEELVGDIQDEFDTEEELIKVQDADTAICHSRIRLEDLNETLRLDLPTDEADTLGGFLYEMVGRVPRVGEVIRHGTLEFKVQSVARHRIEKVLIKGFGKVEKKIEDRIG